MPLSAQEKHQNELDVLWVMQQLIGPFAAFNYSYVGWEIVDGTVKGRKATTLLRSPDGKDAWTVEVLAGQVWALALQPTLECRYGNVFVLNARNSAGAYCAFAATDKESVEFYGQPLKNTTLPATDALLFAVRDALAVSVPPPTPKRVEVLNDYIAYAKFLAEGMCDGS